MQNVQPARREPPGCWLNLPLKGLTMKSLPVGTKFGRLTTIGEQFRCGYPNTKVVCECECGTIMATFVCSLRAGNTTSCGCYKMERIKTASFKHGLCKDSLYYRWNHMLNRCTLPNHKQYPDYGGRGITVCEDWKDFRAFAAWAFSSGYRKELELDRRDNDKGYSPDNCRWVTEKQNCRNRRSCVFVTAFGETKTIVEWSEDPRCQCSKTQLGVRLKMWPAEEAITRPLGPTSKRKSA